MPATPAWPPKSAPRLFVQTTLAMGQMLTIDGQQGHYLAKVMRVAPGDAVICCDDVTGEWLASVAEAGKRAVTLKVERQLRPREQVPDLWLCPALLKKDRFDMVLEKATELGVAAIRPVLTRRCVADKLNPDRARTIVTEAAEQCARTALPALAAPQKLDALLRNWPGDRLLFFADEEGGQAAAEAFAFSKAPQRGQGAHRAAILIGPEGGFDDAEREAIRAHPQARPISLGPRILRAETAALAAVALWMGLVGDWDAGA